MKSIPEYPDYQIDETGQIWSNKTNKYLSPGDNGLGYLIVNLTNSAGFKCKKIHRLVAEAYLPNPLNYPVVMHLDNNPLNNSVSNLCWGTVAENNQQAWTDGLQKPNYKKVICLTDNKVFESLKSAAEYYGLRKSGISLVCSGKLKSTGGKVFRFMQA